MGSRSMKALQSYGENNIFLAGVIANIGFPSSIVFYDQKRRIAGVSKYNYKKLFRLALDSISSFTLLPIRILLIVGIISSITSACYIIYIFYVKYALNNALPVWASIVLPIWLFGSIQLLAMGILGEYLAKLIFDVKKRPRFIIENEIK